MEHMHHEALDTDLNKLEQAVRSLHDWVVNLSNSLATQGHELSMLRSTVEGLHTNVGDFRRSGQRIVIDSCDLEVRDANLYVHTGTGSHPGKNGKGNLVVGKSHDVSMARNGLVSGTSNTIRGQAPTVLGGATNIADGDYSVVIGGKRNHAKGTLSLVNGGAGNSAEGTCSCVFGGQKSVARERHAVEIGSDQRLDRAPSSVTSIGGRSVTSIGELHSRDLESWAASSPCSPCSPRASLPENEVTHGEVSGSTKASPLRASLQEDFAATGRVSASSQPEAEMPVTKRSGPGPAPGDVERRGNETRNSGQHALHWQVLLLTALAIILALNWVHLFKVSTESADLSVEHLQTHMLECNVTEAIREATLSELQKHRFATHGDLEATREATLSEVRKYRFAKQSDLEAMREVTMSEVHKHRAATEERVGQKISDLEATRAATLSEVHKQRAITEERIDQKISDLEAIRDATLSEVLKQRVAAEEYVDQKIFELCTPPSMFKGEQGATVRRLSRANAVCSNSHDHDEAEQGAAVRRLSRTSAVGMNTQRSDQKGGEQDLQTQSLEGNAKSDCAVRSATKSSTDATGTLPQSQEEQGADKEIQDEAQLEAALPESPSAASGDYVDQRISSQQSHLSHIKSMLLNIKVECASGKVPGGDQLLEMQTQSSGEDQMLEIQEQPSPGFEEVQLSDFATISDLEAVREVAWLELKEHVGAAKKSLNEKICELDVQLSQIRGEHASDQISEMRCQMREMRALLSEHVKSDAPRASAKQCDDGKISETHEQLAVMKRENVDYQYSEMRDQIREMQVLLVERGVKSDSVGQGDLQALALATLTELQRHGSATREHVDKKLSDMQSHLSAIKCECDNDQMSEIKVQMQSNHAACEKFESVMEAMKEQVVEMTSQMQEVQRQMSARKLDSNMVTQSDLEAMREANMSELRGFGEAIKVYIDKKISRLPAGRSEIETESAVDGQGQSTEMQTQLSEIKAKSDAVCHGDLQALALATLTELQRHGSATRQHVDKKISELQERLSEISKHEFVNDQMAEMQGQMQSNHAACEKFESVMEVMKEQVLEMTNELQEMRGQMTAHKANSDPVMRSDLDAIREAALSELRRLGQSTKDHVDKKISELHSHCSEKKHEPDVEQLGPGAVTKEHVDREISELHTSLSEIQDMKQQDSVNCKDLETEAISKATGALVEIKEHLARLLHQSEAVTQADLDAMRDYLLGLMSVLQDDVHELRNDAVQFNARNTYALESADKASVAACTPQWFSIASRSLSDPFAEVPVSL